MLSMLFFHPRHFYFQNWITVTIKNLHKFQSALFALLNLLNDLDSNIKNFSQSRESFFIPKRGNNFGGIAIEPALLTERNAVIQLLWWKKITSHFCCRSCGCGFFFMVLFQSLWPCSCCSHVAWSQKWGFSVFFPLCCEDRDPLTCYDFLKALHRI